MDRAGAELPVLIGQTGPLNGQRWLIERELILGRDASCDIVISDRQVSRFHARISLTEEGVMLEDLGSKNGTFQNGKRLEEPVILSDGDQVQISLVQHFVFLSSDATVPLEFETPLPKSAGARPSFPGHAFAASLVRDNRNCAAPLGSPVPTAANLVRAAGRSCRTAGLDRLYLGTRRSDWGF